MFKKIIKTIKHLSSSSSGRYRRHRHYSSSRRRHYSSSSGKRRHYDRYGGSHRYKRRSYSSS
ncbi:hypothetical protein ABZM97_01275 [Bacillus vallismortis]|uniref:Uncharacterized protein n=1 Tax=Bacillus vallismortis TaxID=72361 RepID=A0ABY4XZN8_BACVA|nr:MULTISPECIES: hypothetical protein [Bacillus]MBL3649843.1 hypothetical protein [Bacillus sp. RHFS10]USP95743.1 hypothetical protein MKF32_01135 [Bacillus vallismortis]